MRAEPFVFRAPEPILDKLRIDSSHKYVEQISLRWTEPLTEKRMLLNRQDQVAGDTYS